MAVESTHAQAIREMTRHTPRQKSTVPQNTMTQRKKTQAVLTEGDQF